MTEEQKQALIEKCKNEISRYTHLVKTFDPNEGEEMEEYQQNIQDWNDIISVNTLALVSLTAPAADLAKMVPDAKAIRKEAGGYAPVYSLQEQQLFIDGASWLRAATLRNIEECGSLSSGADWFREQYLLKITPPQKHE
jgi:hypothetical protein